MCMRILLLLDNIPDRSFVVTIQVPLFFLQEREEFHRLKMVKAKKIRKQVRSIARQDESNVGGGESTGMYHFNMVGVAMVGQMGHLFPPMSLASKQLYSSFFRIYLFSWLRPYLTILLGNGRLSTHSALSVLIFPLGTLE